MKPRTFALPLILLVGAAFAQKASLLQLDLQQSLVHQEVVGGKTTERLVANPKNVLPGDVLSQVVTATNTSNKPMTAVKVNLPVPKGTQFVGLEPSLKTTPVQYSIDGGKTFAAAPLKRRVMVKENGKDVVREVEVQPNEYNAVRWNIPEIVAGQNQRVGFRIKVQ